jgi:hypothetical protein
MTIATLAYADAATRHRLAVARHAELAAASAEAKREVEHLKNARAAMLHQGHAGATVAKLKANEVAQADAARRCELVEAQEIAGRRAAEQAEIAALHAQAAELSERIDDAAGRVVQAGEGLRVALEAARAALVQLGDAGYDLSAANNAGRLFGADVKIQAVSNRELAALQPNLWPKVKPGPLLDPIWGVITLEFFEKGTEEPANAAALLAGLPHLTPVLPTAPAQTRDTSDDRVSWARGNTPPGPDSRCTGCGRRHWWIAADGGGGCLTCAPPTVGGPVRKFGADHREPIRPESEPEYAVAKFRIEKATRRAL